MNTPPCAKWGIWVGKEIEGEDQLGQFTLFIRYTNGYSLENVLRVAEYYRQGPYYRVWICKEQLSGNLGCNPENVVELVRMIQRKWHAVVAFEVATPVDHECVSVARKQLVAAGEILENRMVIFAKIPWLTDLKQNDYVCVGPAFNDTAIRAYGNQVKPEQYLNDVCLDGMMHLH